MWFRRITGGLSESIPSLPVSSSSQMPCTANGCAKGAGVYGLRLSEGEALGYMGMDTFTFFFSASVFSAMYCMGWIRHGELRVSARLRSLMKGHLSIRRKFSMDAMQRQQGSL